MKALLLIMVAFEVLFVVLTFSPVFIDRKSAARALVEWKNNPTPENKLVWDQEAGRIRSQRKVIGISIFTLLSANTLGLVAVVRKLRGAAA